MKDDAAWLSGTVVSGHGVASGCSEDSPYPAGTIAMQTPHFRARGLDFSDCWPGTINLSFAPLEVRLRDADHQIPALHWTELHPPETFSFWRIQLRSTGSRAVEGWIYRPHPETKQRHWQPESMLELLAPPLAGVASGDRISIHDRENRIRLIDTARLRSRLLECLKFRVLASQDLFFRDTAGEQRRDWLRLVHPEALELEDRDLDRVWNQAKQLYTES